MLVRWSGGGRGAAVMRFGGKNSNSYSFSDRVIRKGEGERRDRDRNTDVWVCNIFIDTLNQCFSAIVEHLLSLVVAVFFFFYCVTAVSSNWQSCGPFGSVIGCLAKQTGDLTNLVWSLCIFC